MYRIDFRCNMSILGYDLLLALINKSVVNFKRDEECIGSNTENAKDNDLAVEEGVDVKA